MVNLQTWRARRTGRVAVVVGTMALAGGVASAPAVRADDLTPYSLPVNLPAANQVSPSVDPRAPYTPVVLDLIRQLEPSSPPTRAQLANAAKLLHGAGAGFAPSPAFAGCHNVGPVAAPTGTNAEHRAGLAGRTRRAC